jgi:hypothetical protein
MQDFVDMAEAHAWTLQRLREMGGRLTEQAYQRACAAAADRLDDEAHARWMLVFDRMARGLRLSIALEAKLARERRRDAAEIGDELVRAATDEHPAPRGRAPAARSRDIEPRECDREADDDGLPADATLSQRLDRLGRSSRRRRRRLSPGSGSAGTRARRPWSSRPSTTRRTTTPGTTTAGTTTPGTTTPRATRRPGVAPAEPRPSRPPSTAPLHSSLASQGLLLHHVEGRALASRAMISHRQRHERQYPVLRRAG